MSVPRCRRCWSIWLLGCGLSFAYLERRAWTGRCHKTLSRELHDLLGDRGSWVFTALGAVFTIHLLKLQELEAEARLEDLAARHG